MPILREPLRGSDIFGLQRLRVSLCSTLSLYCATPPALDPRLQRAGSSPALRREALHNYSPGLRTEQPINWNTPEALHNPSPLGDRESVDR